MNLGLTGRVAIVAAASKGLGRAVEEELAREGARVAICARTASTLAETAAHIQKTTGQEVFDQALNVTDSTGVAAFVADVEARLGRADDVLQRPASRHDRRAVHRQCGGVPDHGDLRCLATHREPLHEAPVPLSYEATAI